MNCNVTVGDSRRTPSLGVQARGMGVRGSGPEDLFVSVIPAPHHQRRS